MAVYRPSEGRNQKKANPLVQPNLVPIMNLFLAIIPFLLMMVVITQVAMVALNFSAAGGAGSTDTTEKSQGGGTGTDKEIKIVIMASEGLEMYPGFEIREKGAPNVSLKNSDNNGRYNFIKLNEKLSELKKANPDLSEIIVVAYPNVVYGTLIQTIDLCKQNGFPNVRYRPAVVSYGTGGV